MIYICLHMYWLKCHTDWYSEQVYTYLLFWSSAFYSRPVSEELKEICFEVPSLRVLAMNIDPNLCMRVLEELAEVNGKPTHVNG